MKSDIREIRREMAELRGENAALRAQLDGDIPQATRWLQSKVERQRKALDTLNRKVATQRFRLRLLAELGRDLSYEEYVEARDNIGNEQLRDRIDEELEPVLT